VEVEVGVEEELPLKE
jgi:hypothetical protein